MYHNTFFYRRRLATIGLFLALMMIGFGFAFTGPALAQSQTVWAPLPDIDSYTSPAISSLGNTVPPLSHFVGRTYVAAIAFNGLVAYISTDSPGGWDEEGWKIIGPEPTSPFNQAFYADPNTPPIFARDGNTLYLFVRGKNNNLYETHRTLSADWSDWKPLTSDGPVRGRLSVALTRQTGSGLDVLDIHVVYTSANNTVEYRQFDPNGTQAGPTEFRINAVEATLGTGGADEVLAVIRTNDGRLLIERKSRTRSRWELFQSLGEIVYSRRGEFFDISNIVRFGDAYHVAYAVKYPNTDEFGTPFLYSLDHARIRSGQPNDYSVRTIMDYTPRGDTHPQAELILYRNKLVAAYKDHQGWVRYAYWDNADPATPWIGNDIVAGGSTIHRPALAVLNQCEDLRSPECIDANFGHDLLSVVNDSQNRGWLWFINFSRAFFKQRLAQIGVAVRWCTEYVKPPGGHDMVKCPPLNNPPNTDELPVFTEVGYGTIVLPNWLMSRIFWRTLQAGGQSGLHNTWLHTQDIGAPYVGPNINIDRKMDYFRWWEEGGHVLASGLGLCDDGFCASSNPPDPNLMSDFIPNPAVHSAFSLFHQRVNGSRSCQAGTGSDGRRCRGFTGYGNNYDVGTRQHSFMYPLLFYYARGDQLRQWVQEDLNNNDDLLKRKYDWVRQYIFQGVEFERDAEPLPSNE